MGAVISMDLDDFTSDISTGQLGIVFDTYIGSATISAYGQVAYLIVRG